MLWDMLLQLQLLLLLVLHPQRLQSNSMQLRSWFRRQ
jgi:hypothetical protein